MSLKQFLIILCLNTFALITFVAVSTKYSSIHLLSNWVTNYLIRRAESLIF
jgi:hypothetical protein